MKRAALVVAVVVAVIAAIVLALRGEDDDVAPAIPAAPRAIERAVVASTAGHAAPHRQRAVEPAAETKAIETPTPGRIDGVVVERQSEKPFAHAEILVSRRRTPAPAAGVLDDELPGEAEIHATSGEDGAFAVDVPDKGPWIVVARAPEHVDAVALARPGETLRLVLSKGAESVITVLGASEMKPIVGAEVWVRGPEFKGPPRVRVLTDDNGVARVTWGPAFETSIVRAKGYAQHFSGAFFGNSRVVLAPGYSIRGVVRDHAGHGVAGAVLRFQGGDPRAWITDSGGAFGIEEVRSGTGPAEVTADGFLKWTGVLDLGDDSAVVELGRAASVTGTVLLPDGSPAERAMVENNAQVTDGTGAFRLADVRPGATTISATWSAPGSTASDALVGVAVCDVPDGGTLDSVVIRLQSKSYVVLRVVDDTGRAIKDFRGWIAGGDSVPAQGDLLVLGVLAPPGSRRDVGVSDVRRDGLRWSSIRSTAVTQPWPGGTPMEIRLPARRDLTVDVVASDGSELPPTVRPKVELGEEWAFNLVARIRENGASATWTVDPAHTYVLTISAPGSATLKRQVTPEEIAAGRVSMRLDPGVTVRGRLVSTDSRAAQGAAIRLDQIGPGHAEAWRTDIQRDADGVFRFEHVAPGRWRLAVDWPTPSVVTREFDVASGVDVDAGDLSIPTAVTLRGTVERPDGRPCGAASVEFREQGSDQAAGTDAVHEDGSFDAMLSSSARGFLLVRKKGFGTTIARIDDVSKPVRIRLVPAGMLDVRIRLPQPAPDSWNWRVETSDGAVKWQPVADAAADVLGFDKRWIARDLGPGPLVVVAEGLDWKVSKQVMIVAGQTVTATLGADR